MSFDWGTFWFVLIAGLLVLGFVLALAWYLSLTRRRKEMPSHIELYFDENFRKIIGEWDLSSRDRVKDFRKDIDTRLKKVGSDIDDLERKRRDLDSRLARAEDEMDVLEAF